MYENKDAAEYKRKKIVTGEDYIYFLADRKGEYRKGRQERGIFSLGKYIRLAT